MKMKMLRCQNAANLEFPATDPANAPARAEFKLGSFPPHHGGDHAPSPQQTPPTIQIKQSDLHRIGQGSYVMSISVAIRNKIVQNR